MAPTNSSGEWHLDAGRSDASALPPDGDPAALALNDDERRERRALINWQRCLWSNGLLARSVWADALDARGLAGHPESVPRPYRLAEPTDGNQRLLPLDARVVEHFDAHQGRLLVVGPPGSGKTTLLRELHRDLLDRAEADEALPVPVLFDLAPWKPVDLSSLYDKGSEKLAEAYIFEVLALMTDQLHVRDGMTSETAWRWVRAGRILPLLDGLDEVRPGRREFSLTVVHTFCRDPLRRFAITCGERELRALPEVPSLHGMLLVQPPVEALVRALLADAAHEAWLARFLEGGGGRNACEGLPPLTTPLMLGVLTLASGEHPPYEGFDLTLPSLRAEMLDRWVSRALAGHAGLTASRKLSAHTRRLRWLCWQLRRTDQSIYHIEAMQPDWLITSEADRRLYAWIEGLSHWMEGGLGRGLLFGLLLGLPLGLLLRWDVGLIGFVAGFVGGGGAGLAHEFDGGPGLWQRPWITLAVHQAWSWQVIWANWRARFPAIILLGFINLAAGILLGLRLVDNVPIAAWTAIMLWVLSGLCLVPLLAQTFRLVDGPSAARLTPNAGLRTALASGLVVGLVMGSLVALPVALFGAAGIALFVGLAAGLPAGMRAGLAPVLYHIVLRLVLARRGLMPLNISAFCDHCARQGVLRRVGGGWQPAHRLLLEHMADQHAATALPERGRL